MANELVERKSTAPIVSVEESRAIQEVQAAMTIAKRFPRDHIVALDRIKQACTRQKLAEKACYQYSRGGTDITGPSIRLAEAIAQNWGNLDFGIKELEQRNGESTVMAYCWDMETNTRQSKVFQVPHSRMAQKQIKKLTDPRDIYELVANQGARRLRACILGIIPGDVVEDAVEQCVTTLATKEKVDADSIKKMLELFLAKGVNKEMIEGRIQRRIEAITPALKVQLRNIYNSLNDGMSKPGDWFDVDEQTKRKAKENANNGPALTFDDDKPGTGQDDDQKRPAAIPQEELANQKNQQEMVSCPAREGDKILVEYCDTKCKSRPGCPAFDDGNGGGVDDMPDFA